MNRVNMQRMADYIRTIPQEVFSMKSFRDASKYINSDQIYEAECNSVGCVIGHCTVLDKPLFESLVAKHKFSSFLEFSKIFCGIKVSQNEDVMFDDNYENKEDQIWDWCFDGDWQIADNTPQGAAKRIEYMLEKGVPDGFYPARDIEHMQSYVNLYL